MTDYYGLLSEIARLALEYAADHGAITPDDVETLMEIYCIELTELLHSQSDRVAGQSPVLKFWQAVADLLAQGKVYFAPRKDVRFIAPDHSELIGWYDEDGDEHVYLLANTALAQAKVYWQALDERFDTLADALRRELWQRGFVARRDKRQLERVTYINTKVGRTRTLVLDSTVLLEKTNIDPSGRNVAKDPPE